MSVVQQGARRPDRDSSHRRIARATAAFAALAVAASLAACSPNRSPEEPTQPATTEVAAPTPTPTPNPTEDPTPTPEPTASAPDDRSELLIQPDEMKSDDEAGAIAAAKYFMGLYEYSHHTGDLTDWNKVALPTCEYCKVVSDGVSTIYESGGRVDTGRITFAGDPETEHFPASGMWQVTLSIRTGATTILDSQGNVTRKFGESRNLMRLGVVKREDGWKFQGAEVSDDK